MVAAEVAPIISATLNGSTEAVLHAGRPGIFEVEITHPELWEETLTPIRLEQAAGVSWTNAIKSTVFDAAGSAVMWPLEMRPVTSTTITLDHEQVGRLHFLLAPADTLALGVGTYAVEFVLDTRADAAEGGWAGIADAIQLNVRVEVEPGTLTAEEIIRRQSQLAQYHALKGDFVAAGALLDGLLATQPRSLEALRMKASVLEAAGNYEGALLLTENALSLFREDQPDPPEPPRDLLDYRYTLNALLLNAGVKITSATARAGELQLIWEGEEGKTYGVESSSDFRAWRIDASGLTAVNGFVNWSGNVAAGTRFFRIVVE